MSTQKATAMIDAHAQLTAAVAEAIKAAIAAGLDRSDITAALVRFTELLESED